MIKINKLVLAVTLSLGSAPLLAAGFACGEHVRFGIPSESSQKLCRVGYAVGYNYDYKVADWVSYQMTSESAQGPTKRKDAFAEDKEIPVAYRATLADYKRSGYDRGHQAPAADMAATATTMRQSFLLSNMTPQLPALNQKAWRILEEKVRNWAIARGDVQVITGPIFTGDEDSIGNGVGIPSAYYKVVMDPYRLQAIAFILPQEDVPMSQLANYRVSVRDVEQQTGLDFFSDLPYDQQDTLEERVSPMWSDR
ncbi:DNA/RNA non-specific endonuclease [Aeromonas schubertii]|uniref:Endonuclease n=1 Tax=Aeromonas schubertii TaxID=652 RepID=A0ABS7VCP7_9GAMM|nr:DNA/RNA non-specific endonuclease [Aeromonas schubertii]MBZ6066768.1 DNA/RNA non-specific endonuclease [Aeromonas schubertii]